MENIINQNELVELLQSLIQIPSVNPPGNETEVAKFIRDFFDENDIKSEIYESKAGRGNIIARIKGSNNGPKLLLLGHLDVVPVPDEDEWTYPPFDGIVKDGYIWGRGALDMKSGLVMEIMTLVYFKRYIRDFNGELIFAGTADEEMGGKLGIEWLLNNYKEKLTADFVITEGGGIPIKNKKGKIAYLIGNAEKGLNWIEVTLKGRTAHASIPSAGINPIDELRDILTASQQIDNKRVMHPITKRIIQELIAHELGVIGKLLGKIITNSKFLTSKLIARLKKSAPAVGATIDALTRNTLTPTIIKCGEKENIIPNSCKITFDCRSLPDFDFDRVEELFLQIARKRKFEIDFDIIKRESANYSSTDTRLWRIINDELVNELGKVHTIPYMLPGATDSRFMRRIGAVAYGFLPLHPEVNVNDLVSSVHGKDERIDIKSLVFGTKIIYNVSRKLLNGQTLQKIITPAFQTPALLSSPLPA
ncbi:MAG: M20/M25/M40 family metallo-hydrolase [Candidatus Asgardarchaeia archaeon]